MFICWILIFFTVIYPIQLKYSWPFTKVHINSFTNYLNFFLKLKLKFRINITLILCVIIFSYILKYVKKHIYTYNNKIKIFIYNELKFSKSWNFPVLPKEQYIQVGWAAGLLILDQFLDNPVHHKGLGPDWQKVSFQIRNVPPLRSEQKEVIEISSESIKFWFYRCLGFYLRLV